jgi:prevent-host-death family protein
MHVAIRELKAHLSSFLQRAQAGETIEVTSHNKLIARIVGIPAKAGEGLRGLVANGLLSWNGEKPRMTAPEKLAARGNAVSQMIVEDRR